MPVSVHLPRMPAHVLPGVPIAPMISAEWYRIHGLGSSSLETEWIRTASIFAAIVHQGRPGSGWQCATGEMQRMLSERKHFTATRRGISVQRCPVAQKRWAVLDVWNRGKEPF
jgi:hypothetical protein